MSEIQKRIAQLRKLLKKYNDLYYKEGISEISDYEYDKLLKELETLETKAGNTSLFAEEEVPDSPSVTVGSDLTDGFKKRKHFKKMLSISNSYNTQDLIEFDRRIKKSLQTETDIEYCVEYKIDGLAVSLVYRSGKLNYALTRGDGETGDDITENMVTLRDVPFEISGGKDFEIRGEIYINKSDFAEINRSREEQGLELLANPRNAAAGSVKLLDSKEAAKRPLRLISYYFDGDGSASKQSENLDLLENKGFPTSGYYEICRNIDEVISVCRQKEEEKNDLDFEIDGLVIKVNDIKLRENIGETSKSPKWAIAYKFKPDRAETLLKDIIFQVGRTGAVTPVAELEPVRLSGTVVKRATLHNFDEIKKKDIRIGDTVGIEKAGEIIPQVVSVDKEKRRSDSAEFKMIENCPVCSEKLVKHEDEVVLRCVNASCPAQLERQIIHFAGKGAMDIEGMGPKMVKNLLSSGIIKSISDIYLIGSHQLSGIERMGEKSSEKLLKAIEESRSRSLENLIFGLGIRHVGKEASISLASKFKSLDNLISADQDSLTAIEDIGKIIAGSITAFFSNSKNIEMIRKLQEYGLNTLYTNENTVTNDYFRGKTFVITGSFDLFSREELRDLIIKNNGKVSSSVGKNTDCLICGENPGSKLDKALEAGVRIIYANELYRLIGKL
ncbi:MAG: NAD-dependent DNA ligase LigA [Candidatus Delongbacteria bacterium]|nr:NAD-dependent DNA ligase LigA [Candidatus Delongbacteria bacterium]